MINGSKQFLLGFREFELIAEGQKQKKMMCSYTDNYFSERLTFEICPLQLIRHYQLHSTLKPLEQEDHSIWWMLLIL